jgi:hypothetical protein
MKALALRGNMQCLADRDKVFRRQSFAPSMTSSPLVRDCLGFESSYVKTDFLLAEAVKTAGPACCETFYVTQSFETVLLDCHENGESAHEKSKDLRAARYFYAAWCAGGT